VSALAVAGLEMRRFLHESGHTQEECAEVAARNRQHSRSNSRASFAGVVDPTPLFDPLTRDQAAESADGCVVMVLAAAGTAGGDPVWVDGVGWNQDAPSLETRDWGSAVAARRAAQTAFAQAGVSPSDVDIAEVDDTFAYKQLQHLDALGLSSLAPDRVNPSGGALGEGHLHEANGLARALACIEAIRGGRAEVAVAQSWRGLPSTSAAVAVMRGG
jgi:acetyl-CoA C-acetyltransferase